MIAAAYGLLFIAYLSTASADKELSQEVQSYIEECRKTHPLSQYLLDNVVLKGAPVDSMDDNTKCFVECFMIMAGDIKDGELDVEHTKAMFMKRVKNPNQETSETLTTGLADCATKTAAGNCGKSYAIWRCLHQLLEPLV